MFSWWRFFCQWKNNNYHIYSFETLWHHGQLDIPILRVMFDVIPPVMIMATPRYLLHLYTCIFSSLLTQLEYSGYQHRNNIHCFVVTFVTSLLKFKPRHPQPHWWSLLGQKQSTVWGAIFTIYNFNLLKIQLKLAAWFKHLPGSVDIQFIVLCKMFSRWFFANKKLIMMIRTLKFGDVTYNVMN